MKTYRPHLHWDNYGGVETYGILMKDDKNGEWVSRQECQSKLKELSDKILTISLENERLENDLDALKRLYTDDKK